ncbi:hypothetical protein QFC21_003173 [Naganishia friedmannii]|uniref:Uncharacterized protein n=1 Tax=Naganishia friedmannii TaxID=89922 RepID=A0ACC2VRP6_9TREE|nr:hypothetical protein QFC21_003173 [Naganishia friedmannii]
MTPTNFSHSPPPEETTTIPATDLARLQQHLNLPSTGYLSTPYTTPLSFLAAYIDLIPPSLTYLFHDCTTPQERSRIKQVKARRMIWAGLGGKGRSSSSSSSSKPDELSAEEGWKRFPLLWERLGGDPLGPPRHSYTAAQPDDGDAEENGERMPRDRQRDELIDILGRNRPAHSDDARGGRAKPKPKPRSQVESLRGGGGLFGAMDDDDDDGQCDDAAMSSIPLHSPSSSKTSPSTHSEKTPSTAPPPPAQPTSKSAHLESQWPTQSFMPTNTNRSSVLQVNKLGSLMRDLEEESEALQVVAARRRERREMAVQERSGKAGGMGDFVGGEDDEQGEQGEGKNQEQVVEAFERHLLELFLDGMDTIPYSDIDFTEPPDGNPLLEQDAQDDYFDDEEEFDYRSAGVEGAGGGMMQAQVREGEQERKLADGEYDY